MRRLSDLPALLDMLPAPVDAFVRDDDAGWDDAGQLALLDLTQRAGVPIDLAAIPSAVSDTLAHALRERIDAAPALVALHQHGHAHANHEPDGRKCEFGATRSLAAQRDDLLHGRTLLAAHFGTRVQAVFTPPWNRCSGATATLLAALGWQALSRSRGAQPVQCVLPELPVDLDWSKHWRAGGADAVAQALGAALRARAADGAPLGLMLHHAAMDDDERRALRDLLAAAASHPRLRWHPMRALLPTTPPAAPRAGTA